MTKIRLLTSLAGPHTVYRPGVVIEVADDEAARHVANGNAVAVDGPKPVEQAVVTHTPARPTAPAAAPAAVRVTKPLAPAPKDPAK